MISQDSSPVKRLIAWIDAHPRTGWYTAIMVTINLIVTFISLFHP